MLIILLLTVFTSVKAQQFIPGCSFFNGKCVYNVQLGQQENCHGNTPGRRALNGGCSCSDVTTVATDLNSLQDRVDKLTKSMTDFKNQLNNVAPKTDSIQSPSVENQKYLKLLANLQTKDDLLNRTNEEVSKILKTASSEIASLREQLKNTTGELATCKISSGAVVTKPLSASSENYTTFYCNFQNSDLCHFSQDHDDSTSWYHQKSAISFSSGPREDHTYGNNYGYYMALRTHDTSKSRQEKSVGRITSTSFPPASNYCVRFWYTMYGKDVDALNVYAKVGSGRGYAVYTVTGNVDPYWHMAQIKLGPEYTKNSFQITFEASHNAYKTTRYSGGRYVYEYHNDEGNIAIDDVHVYNTSCMNLPMHPKTSFMRADGNNTSYYTFHTTPATWYDAQAHCRIENARAGLAVVKSASEQTFLENVITSNVDLIVAGQNGYFINGNDITNEGRFKWTNTGYPESVNYTNFHQGQPNNVGDNQDCLLMEYPASNYQWGDVGCYKKHPYICEINLP